MSEKICTTILVISLWGEKEQNLFGCANISYIKETFLNYSIFSFLWMQPFSLSSIIVNRLCFGKDFYT